MNPRELPAKRNSKIEKAAQGAMGVIGSGSIILYQKPSENCAALASCAQWLSNATNPSVATWSLFFSGGLDFAAVNVFFAVDSIPRFVDYMQKQTSLAAKIAKASLVLTYSASQLLNPLLTSIGTGAAPWQTLVTVLGFSPGIVYTSVNLADTHIPQLAASICQPDIEDKEHFKKQQTSFNLRLKANWLEVLGKSRNLQIPANADPLTLLFDQQAPEYTGTYLRSALRSVFTLGGITTASGFIMPLMLNCYKVATGYVPNIVGMIGAPLMLSSMMYNAFKLSVGGFHSAFDILESVALRKPLPSLSYQLLPKTTAVAATTALLTASLSYATLYMLFYGSYKDEYPLKQQLGIAAIVATDIYHFIGVLHLYNLILRRFATDTNKQFLFALQKKVDDLQKMPLQDFINFAESLTDDERESYGIEMPEDLDEVRLSDLVNGPEIRAAAASESYVSSWCGLWRQAAPAVSASAAARNDQVVNPEPLLNSYSQR